jgi:hypothetical protein
MSPQVEGVLASLNHALELAAPMSDLAADAGEIVGRERAAFIAGIDRERTALEHFVRDERRAFMAEVASERHAALQEAAAVGHSLVDRAFDRLQQVLLRVAFAVALGLAAVLLVWFLVSRGRRRGIPAPSARARQSATLTEREA